MDSNKTVVVALLAMAMFLGVIRVSHAAERVADPAVWGVYARLVGTAWKGEFGTRATRWGEGDQMIEDDATFGQSVITPGPTPGTLLLKLGSTGLHTFQGTVANDSSVLWIREGMLKMPYRVLLRDGELLEEQVKLSGREVASVKRTMRYQQVDGPGRDLQSSATVAGADAEPSDATQAPGPGSVQERVEHATRFLDQLEGNWTNGVNSFHSFKWSRRGVSMSLTNGQLGTPLEQPNARIEIDPSTGNISYFYDVVLSSETVEFECAGSIRPDGALRMEPVTKQTRGQTWRMLAPDQFEWQADASKVKKPFLISKAEWAEITKSSVVVLSPVDLSRAHAQKRSEMDAVAAEQRAVRSEERAAQRARQEALYNALQGELATATQAEAESRADLDYTLATMNAQAEAQRQQQAQMNAQAQHEAGLQQLQAAEAASHQATVPSATGPTAGGSLTVESVAQSPRAAPAASKDASTNSGEEFMFCVVLNPGGFEGHKGARFYSEIAEVVIRYGQVQAAGENFLADVKAAYGINGPSSCSHNKNRAALERLFQDEKNVPSYRMFKTVMTGISPRN